MADGNQGLHWTRRHTSIFLVCVLGIVFVGLLPIPSLISWWLFFLLMGACTLIVSDGVTDSYWGLLIDERNRMSLSRLQMVLWMLVIVSAFPAAAIGNVRLGVDDPLAIAIPRLSGSCSGSAPRRSSARRCCSRPSRRHRP